jgi:hypothetical protein
MGIIDGEHALIADNARAFADATLRAYTDATLWQKLSDGGFAHVAATFAPEVVRRIVDESLGEAISHRGHGDHREIEKEAI